MGTGGRAMDLSKAIAAHLIDTRFEDLPERAVAATKKSLLDAVGVTLAASSLGEACGPFATIASGAAGQGGATAIGFGFRTSPAMAAFVNGSMAHSLDYEDTFDPALVHPNAAVVPAALALAETTPWVTGRDLLTAVALGADLTCRLGLAIDEQQGPGARSMCGTFGATAAAGKLLGLDREQFVHAFALSMFQSGFPAEASRYAASHMRGVREAFAAQAGVVSAQLAAGGVRAFDTPFEGRYDEVVLLDQLGQRYEGVNVSFKPWPSCRGTHSFIEAALGLCSDHAVTSDLVRSAHVVISPFFQSLCAPAERKQRPQTVIDAKFSVPFTLATALVEQGVTLDSFTDMKMVDPYVLTLAAAVDHEVDERIPTHEANHGVLTLHLRDGRSLTREIRNPLGHPDNPMSSLALAEKFAACAGYARVPLAAGGAERIRDAIANLEQLEEVAGFLA